MAGIFLFQFHSEVIATFVSQYSTTQKPSACRQHEETLEPHF